MRHIKVTILFALAAAFCLVPADAAFYKEATSFSVTPATITPGSMVTMTLSGVQPNAWNLLLISPLQGTSQMGEIEIGLQPPFLLTFFGISGTSGQISLSRSFDVVPPELDGSSFSAQCISFKLIFNNGVTIDSYTSNVASFAFSAAVP